MFACFPNSLWEIIAQDEVCCILTRFLAKHTYVESFPTPSLEFRPNEDHIFFQKPHEDSYFYRISTFHIHSTLGNFCPPFIKCLYADNTVKWPPLSHHHIGVSSFPVIVTLFSKVYLRVCIQRLLKLHMVFAS